MKNEYDTAVIKNVHRGKKSQNREHVVYAELYSEEDELLISATIEYIVEALLERKTKGE